MLTIETFFNAYESFRPPPNPEQRAAIEQAPDEAVFIVAGPGTGKTTCLALRILKLILVDGIAPRGVLAATFTVKAAEELRSRILSWGFRFAAIQNILEQNGKILMSTSIVFRRWRDRAIAFVNSDKSPDGLLSYSAA